MSTRTFPSSTQLPGIDIKISRTVQWQTRVQEAVSGKEVRVGLRSYPRRSFALQFNFLRSSTVYVELQTLEGFFNARQGMYDSFLWTDPDDNGSSGQSLGLGDSTAVDFQIYRTFGTFVEPIYAPNTIGNLIVGTSVRTSTQYSFTQWGTASTLGPGVISFTTGAPPNGQAITADLSFWYPVRFGMDDMTFDRLVNLIYDGKKLSFESII